MEKVIHAQLKSFLDEHDVLEVFQSGFKTLHSTESALLRVFNDFLLANDHVILVLLDLTAAFDTVDHNTLVARLRHLVGIFGTALEWLRSYLADRSMSVSLGTSKSSSGVPQGSILGPMLSVLTATGFHPEKAWRQSDICAAEKEKCFLPHTTAGMS